MSFVEHMQEEKGIYVYKFVFLLKVNFCVVWWLSNSVKVWMIYYSMLYSWYYYVTF